MPDDAREGNGLTSPVEEARPVRRALVFAIVALALVMSSVDATIVATALNSLQQGLGTSINWAGWTLTAYSFGLVLMLPVSGKFCERYGHRRIFVGSVVVFTVASLGCGLADNIYVLIALRALQAAGGAGFTPAATGIVVNHFGKERDRALGMFGSMFPIGSMIGPIFGGLFVTYWTWRGIFLVNVPIGIAVALLAMGYIPRDRLEPKRAQGRIDILGVGLLGIGLIAGMLAASYLGEVGAHAGSIEFISLFVITIAALWAFFRHSNNSTQPFIDPHMIHGLGFGPVNLLNALYGGITGGLMALVPLYAINRYGIDALGSGTLLTAQGIAAIALSFIATLVLRHTGYRQPLYIGHVVMAIGMVLLIVHPMAGISPYAWLAISTSLVGAGNGVINPASRNAGLQLAPDRAPTLAALRTMGRQMGAMVTISIATAILAGSRDPGSAQAGVYIVAAVLIVATMAVITRVPDHRGVW